MKVWLIPLAVVVAAIAVAIAGAISPSGSADRGRSKPTVFSIRHEPGANGHTLTTVAFSVRGENDSLYLCVVTEDQSYTGAGVGLTLAQSCDFSVPVGG